MKWLIIVVVVVVTFLLLRLIYVAVSIPLFKSYWNHGNSKIAKTDSVKIVVLGDSSAQSIGALMPSGGFAGRINNYVRKQTGKTTVIYNFSLTGGRVADVLNTQVAKVQTVKNPDLILVAVGPNDVTRGTSTRDYINQYQQILEKLPVDKVVIANIPPLERRKITDQTIHQWNATINTLAKQNGVKVADVYSQIYPRRNNPLIYAGDFFHPSGYGYKFWAKAFEQQAAKVLAQ